MEGLEHPATGRILAAGELLWDLLPAGPRLGGTTANFAIGCARLGRPSALISRLGADEQGARARRALHRIRDTDGAALLDTSLIQISPSAPTGVVEVTVGPDGHPAYEIAMPAAWDDIHATPEALAACRSAVAFCFGTLAQRAELSRSAIRHLALATPPGCLRVLDVNVRAPFFTPDVARWSLDHASIAKISDEELDTVARAVGSPGLSSEGLPSLAELERCGHELLATHPNLRLLAITMGPGGSLLLTATEAHHHPGFLIAVTDTVGAGDAFTAGLVHAYLAGGSLAAINEVGNLCGSFVASQQGATPCFPASLMEKVAAALGKTPQAISG